MYCCKCDKKVKRERDKELKKEYPFFCKNCYENLYYFETYIKK